MLGFLLALTNNISGHIMPILELELSTKINTFNKTIKLLCMTDINTEHETMQIKILKPKKLLKLLLVFILS